MSAGAVLASASLAVSAHIDVKLPSGQTKPASIFLWSIAESGERKTTVDDYAFAAQKRREQKLRALQAAELKNTTLRTQYGRRKRRQSPNNIRRPAKSVQKRIRKSWRNSAPNR
jgi:hypothetical protein